MDLCLPSNKVVFKAMFGVHLLSALWNIINDCDETFNYWEPLHFLIYGRGFQTWEYAPQYALRSYTYLWLYGLPATILRLIFGINGRGLFYTIRIFMVLITTVTETYLYSVLVRRFRGSPIAAFTTLFLGCSAGTFISCTAFLPSSFAMYLGTTMLAAWIDKKYKLAVACVALSAIAGWPFSAALGIPLVIDMVFLRRLAGLLIRYSCLFGIVFSLPLVLIDSWYFGHFVIAPLNILKYNVFNEHGSELYGVESFVYYIKNYMLNFNLAFCLSLMAPIMLYTLNMKDNTLCKERSRLAIFVSPFFVWNLIFFLQPHKEERFLFPAYSILSLSAAISLCYITEIIKKISNMVTYLFTGTFLTVFILLNVSRIMGLIAGYSAPLSIYGVLTQPNFITQSGPIHVCIGREWHRFPSSFFLHSARADQSIHLKLIESDFRGQLPSEFDNRWNNATSLLHSHFNTENKEESSRYWPLNRCDYLIDRDMLVETSREPRYMSQGKWTQVASLEFLNAEVSGAAYRSFYIPYFFKRKNIFVNYVLLKQQSVV